jgi:hypothetical protein
MKGTGSPDETGEPGGFALHQAVMIIPYYPVLRSAMSRSAARIRSRSASADSRERQSRVRSQTAPPNASVKGWLP